MRLETQFLRAFTAKLDEILSEEIMYLAEGSSKSQEEYKFRVGKIQGMREALTIATIVEQGIVNPKRKEGHLDA